MDALVEKISSFTEHPLEHQSVGAGTVAEIEAGLAERVEHLGRTDTGRWVDVADGIYHLGGGEEVGSFSWGRCRAIGGLQGSDVDTDVCDGLRGGIVVLCHCRKD